MTHVHFPGTAPLFAVGGVAQAMAQRWWLVLLRGLAAIAFAVLAFGWPGLTLLTLTVLWGAYAFVDGALALWGALSGKGMGAIAPRWWLAVVGVAGFLAGVAAFGRPDVVALVLLMFIAGWALVAGVMQIWGGFRLRREVQGEWLLILNGVLDVAIGVLLIARPGVGALAVVWMIGLWALLAGCTLVALAFRLRKRRAAA
jgi:uncharacterized membrane protein HdeD (DUF308 family)